MKQYAKLVLFMVASLTLMSFRTADERAAEALARRVMGSKAKAVVFEQMDATTDAYELLQRGNKVLIRGNNANSMAVGLNRYIQQYCLANVSWYHFNPVELPATMPQVPTKVSGQVEVPIRFFLNYCTFGYTMPWWKLNQRRFRLKHYGCWARWGCHFHTPSRIMCQPSPLSATAPSHACESVPSIRSAGLGEVAMS